MKLKIAKLEQRTFEEDDSPEVPPPDIVAYNELRSCADLFRMHTKKALDIQPAFQREIVWKGPAQTRFIDSLVKQLPIPSMCFSLDYRTQKWQVIDGLQRMASIIRFLSGESWTLSNLADIDPRIAGQPVSRLRDPECDLHGFYTRVENLTLPITVLRCDHAKRTHTNYLFSIFHRLNTGAMKLNNQEIRNCIFSGRLNALLKELGEYKPWIRLNKIKTSTGYRFTKHELILRMFAFRKRYKKYGGRLAKFLNEYMADHRNPSDTDLKTLRTRFVRTVDLVFERVFEGKAPPKIPLALFEALLVGVSFNLRYLEPLSDNHIRSLWKKLLEHEEFSDNKLSEGLSGKPRVIGRITAARSIFAEN